MIIRIATIIIGLSLLMACNSLDKVASNEKKKDKWLENLVVDEDHYQVVVSVPFSESMAENAKKAEMDGKFKMALEIEKLSSNQIGQLLTEILDENSEKEVVARYRLEEIAKGISNMEVFSSFKSSNEYSVCYRINKKEYEKLREKAKSDAVDVSIVYLESGRKFRSDKNPLEAAKEYSNAMIAIQEFLHEPIEYAGVGDVKYLDQAIFEEMIALRGEMSIKCDPKEEILLNHENAYTEILSFEVLQANEKTGKIDVSIDVAGLRNESILVNGYSVLVGNLPPKMGNSFVTIRSDLYNQLRTNGNGLCAMVYQKLMPITEKVMIKKIYPNIEVKQHSDALWDQFGFEELSSRLKTSGIYFEENESTSRVIISPEIKYTEENKPSHFKITGQWILNFGDGMERYVGQKLTFTETSKDKAIRQLERKLNGNLTSTVIPDLTKILEKQ